MKKCLTLFLVLLMTAGLFGCGFLFKKTAEKPVETSNVDIVKFTDYETTFSALEKFYQNEEIPEGTIELMDLSEICLKRVIIETDKLDLNGFSPECVVELALENTYIIQFSSDEETKRFISYSEGKPGVNYVVEDELIDSNEDDIVGFVVPESDFTPMAGSSMSWGVSYTGMDTLASYVKNKGINNSITVAVVDTGLDTTHPYFKGKISPYSTSVIGGTANDVQYHGTHVAGTILDCMEGLNVSILPVRVFVSLGNDEVTAYTTAVINGVTYAVDHGAKVINLSLGGSCSGDALHSAIEYANKKGCVLCIAAGNDKTNTAHNCPAHVKSGGAITVSAIDERGNLARFTNYGNDVDVAAPGVNICSTIPVKRGSYGYLNGTSMAAPHVSAAAAMTILLNPTASAAEIESMIKEAAIDSGDPGFDIYYGYGILNGNKIKNGINPEKYTVTYNSIGGTVSPSSESVEKGKAVIIPTPAKKVKITYDANQGINAPSFLEVSLSCQGWTVSSNASSAQYKCGSSYTVNANSNLYAVWDEANFRLSTSAPSRNGYEFVGWARTASARTAEYNSGDLFTTKDNVTLYAVWQQAEVTLTSISIATQPSKTSYYVGDILNTSGLSIRALYSNGTSASVNTGFTCSPTNFSSAGTKTVTVYYGGKTTSFQVSVSDVTLTSISIATQPSKTSYYVGDTLNTSGLSIRAVYSNGTSATLNTGFTCSQTNFSSAGTKTITVSYGGKTASFQVSVSSVALTSISLATKPSKTSYYVGDTLNTSGLSIKATYSNGTSATLNTGFSCSPTIFSSSGTKTITVSYGGKTTNFQVSVSQVALTSISIATKPSKTSYFEGDSLNTSGLSIIAVYSNGTSATLNNGFTCSPTSFGSSGAKTITVSYGGKTATFQVSVSEVTLESISILTNLYQTSYYVGDALNTSGLSIKAVYNNGVSATIDNGFTCSPTSFSSSGTKTITVSYGGKTTSFSVIVIGPSLPVISDLMLSPGCMKDYSYIISDSNATSITLTSSNTSVATVSGYEVFAHNPGTSIITFKAFLGGESIQRTITVTVNEITPVLSSYSKSETKYADTDLSHGGPYEVGCICEGKLAWEVALPDVSNSSTTYYGDIAVLAVDKKWEVISGNAFSTGSYVYCTQPGTIKVRCKYTCGGYTAYSDVYTYTLKLVCQYTYSGGYIVRSDHSTSSSRIGSQSPSNSYIEVYEIYVEGPPGKVGGYIWTRTSKGWMRPLSWT